MASFRRVLTPFAALALLALPACSSEENAETAAAEPSDGTLPEAIAGANGLGTVSSALDETGLADIFEGDASYTLFAPNDAAFEALGETGAALREPDQRAALAAVLRDHIVPGYITPDDIDAALQARGGSVAVETMGDQTLRITRSGDGILVTAEGGGSARITGEATRARNGVAIPIDGVLKDLSPSGA